MVLPLSLIDKSIRICNRVFYYFRKSRIHISRAMITNNNTLIDIRYWLTRPDKIKESIPIYIVKKTTGEKFFLEKAIKYGETRARHRIYLSMGVLVFKNTNNLLKSGEKVILYYGDLKATVRLV